jgi:hypothetical protein
MGSTPIGGPLVGALGQVAGPRAALGAGAVGCLIAAALAIGYGLTGTGRGRLRRRLAAPAPAPQRAVR